MSQNIFKAFGVGRLTRDAELKYTSGGMAVCKFSVAFNSRVKNGDDWVDEANFIDVTLFGRAGEAVNQYLVKGKQVAIDGRIKQDRWEKDGQNHSKISIIADNVELLGDKQKGGQMSEADFPEAPPPIPPRTAAASIPTPQPAMATTGETGQIPIF